MNDHPFRSIGRLVLTACALSLSAVSLGAQKPATASGINPSHTDIFLGYSYLGAHGNLQPAGISYSSINLGAIGSAAIYFNDHVGIEAVLTSHPSGANDGATGYSAGMIYRLAKQNFTLFGHTLYGTERLGGPNNDTPAALEHEPYTWGLGLTAGGGLDYNMPFLDNRFSLRLVEADYRYIHENFGTYVGVPTSGVLGGTTNLNAIELNTGLVAHLGNLEPPSMVSYSCSASPSTGFPGDPITVTGMAMNLNPNPKKVVSYTWSTDGGRLSGTSSTATVDTTAASPGSYTVKGHVSQGVNPTPNQYADCSATFTVMAFEPPTISCSASPSSVNRGGSSTITTSAVSPQNRPLTYSFNATAGSISSVTPSATLSTVGAAPGPITVTCGVSDDKGHRVSATTSVKVIAPPPPPPPPPPPAPMASSLCSVSFQRDAKRPTRVDNEAKACLDDITLALQRSPDAKLALVGNEDAKEQKVGARAAKRRHPEPSRAAKRAVNTKDYLVTDKGIDASRILVYTGTDDGKTVTTTLIPLGATNPFASDTTVDASTIKVERRKPIQ